ncbi:MAG: pilus assembly protein [Phycisphaerae bacterium]|nr:pilus assembly protein [Phycisphaerae bacterium]
MTVFSIGNRGILKNKRRAAAVVEMAVVLPVLLTILFGIIEFGWMFMVYQNITNAAREGCRTAVLEGSTDADIQNRINKYMDLVGLSDYQVTLQHTTPTDPTETVIIQVPYGSVSLLGGYFGSMVDRTLSSKACMRKEGAE